MRFFGKILFISSLLLVSCSQISLAADWNLPGVKIITREEWGADESIRLRSTPRTSSTAQQTDAQKEAARKSEIRNARMAKNYPNDWRYDSSITMLGNKYLIYPNYYNHNKTKIIIHHTAMNYDPNRTIDDVKGQLQYIYKYHTINRDFGDIGYNFIIDQMGNIYEGRDGGEGAVGMHAANNNASSIGIALMGNFETSYPSDAQLSSLVNLITALSTYYKIDPYAYTHTFYLKDTDPYVGAKKNLNVMGHKDAGNTACPGTNLYKLLPLIRKEVFQRWQKGVVGNVPLSFNNKGQSVSQSSQSSSKTSSTTSSSTKSNTSTKTNQNFKKLFQAYSTDGTFDKAAAKLRSKYTGNIVKATNSISKIETKYSLSDVKKLLKQNISVLLYELTTKYNSYDILCDGKCIFTIDGNIYKRNKATLTVSGDNILVKSDQNLSATNVEVKSSISGGIVQITNYNRKSYAGIAWNRFKGSLIFEKGTYALTNGTWESGFIVINTLPFNDYMRGIVETNDTETIEKNKVMAMISKNYALFYMNNKNTHPSIPKNADYTAIDDPNFFQKYVGAGLEDTLTKWYHALKTTENEVIMYNGYLPILPYFSCSVGFTLSAEEKRGWNDTPYLQTVYDFGTCKNFSGHGVGLAGQGAEYLAKKGLTYDTILKYYYKGISIEKIN